VSIDVYVPSSTAGAEQAVVPSFAPEVLGVGLGDDVLTGAFGGPMTMAPEPQPTIAETAASDAIENAAAWNFIELASKTDEPTIARC
jgi:hypothetical protein